MCRNRRRFRNRFCSCKRGSDAQNTDTSSVNTDTAESADATETADAGDDQLAQIKEKGEIVVNGVDITEERAQKYDFTEPYAYNRTAIIVTKDNDEIQSFDAE